MQRSSQVGLIANTAKAVMRMLRRRIGRKIADVLGVVSVGSEEGKELGMQFGCRE